MFKTLDPSQLVGAPPPTQGTQDAYATPAPPNRPTKDVGPPQQFTFPTDQLAWGHKKAPKAGMVRGVAPKMGRH
uniref:Uncharacterized protein n=1 Tax=Arundo donax TaxID=35708 RepID=A0A0A9A329_ARUDO